MKSVAGIRYPRLSAVLYLGMGWLALIAIRPLWLYVPAAGWLWLIAGGLAYTAGIGFYAAERVRVEQGALDGEIEVAEVASLEIVDAWLKPSRRRERLAHEQAPRSERRRYARLRKGHG